MFQVVVRFVAVNGTVSTDRVVVTLVDKNGKPAKDGVGHLTKNQIAAATEPTTPPARPTRPTTRTTAPTGNATVENAVTPSEEKVEEKAAAIKEVLKLMMTRYQWQIRSWMTTMITSVVSFIS